MRTAPRFCLASLTLCSVPLACNRPLEPTQPPVAVAGARSAPPAAAVRARDPAERFVVELGDAPTLGPVDAPVTVVMFSDFECPYCAEGLRTLLRLRELYPDEVRIAYKAYPLDNHSYALLAAMAARSAQAQGKFWEFHDLLFSGRQLDPTVILNMARDADLDTAALVQDLDALEYGPEVRRDARQGRRLGVTSTPTFFVNGRVLAGAKPLAAFDQMIQEELRYTDELRAAGVPAQELYLEAMRDGYEAVEYRGDRGALDPDRVFAVPLGDSPSKGPATAPVTVVVFADFACPFCVRAEQTMARIEADYGDQLRIVHKNHPLPFHEHALPAARAAFAAEAQGRFWQFHRALYRRDAQFTADDLRDVAKEAGLDLRAFDASMRDPALQDRVEADLNVATAVGVNGTPAYFINGRPIVGAVPEVHFRLLIEEELERASAALEEGVSPQELYHHLTHSQLAL